MKSVITLLIIITSISVYSQEVDHTGTYYWEIADHEVFKRKLIVYQDGTFTFDWYRNLNNPASPEEFAWGKGTWTSKGKYIYFNTDPENDIDEKYTLNFTNTKGRWDARNNRLILYESDIFWLKRFAIQKQSN